MALPKIDTPKYEITLPVSKKNVTFRPFLVKEQKILLIAMESQESDFIQTEIGYKYQILLYNGEEADFFEAILGDVQHYIKGLVRVGQEGIILKKCKKSEEIMDKIFRGRALEALAKTLIQVKQEAV